MEELAESECLPTAETTLSVKTCVFVFLALLALLMLLVLLVSTGRTGSARSHTFILTQRGMSASAVWIRTNDVAHTVTSRINKGPHYGLGRRELQREQFHISANDSGDLCYQVQDSWPSAPCVLYEQWSLPPVLQTVPSDKKLLSQKKTGGVSPHCNSSREG